MAIAMNDKVLAEAFGVERSVARQVVLVLAGIAALTLAAKIRVPMWPVPMTLQTLAVLSIGAAYGLRLTMFTLIGYVALGAAGLAVFSGDSAGFAYLAGPTGGYLLGFVVAAAAMAGLARKGWDRSVVKMASAMVIGTAIIYAFGLVGMYALFGAEKGLAWVLQYGMFNFLAGDAVKLVLAAMIVPGLWKMVR
jgi:biotin transport system substrate-specific component